MMYPSFEPRLDEEALKKMLRGIIAARIATLPEPLAMTARSLRGATSTPILEQGIDDLKALGIDWSRAGKTTSGWSADYCECIFCGGSAANKQGIEDHMCASQCPVFGSIVTMARAAYCQTRYWRHEVAEKAAIMKERARSLCVVDIHRGHEELTPSYNGRKDLPAIEPRLADLGFTKVVSKLSGRRTETRWEMTTDEAYVLAHPRQEGRIYLRAWPFGHKPKTGITSIRYRSPESILDDWHRDLPKKVAARISKQLRAQ
jgi:hypothetical protein